MVIKQISKKNLVRHFNDILFFTERQYQVIDFLGVLEYENYRANVVSMHNAATNEYEIGIFYSNFEDFDVLTEPEHSNFADANFNIHHFILVNPCIPYENNIVTEIYNNNNNVSNNEKLHIIYTSNLLLSDIEHTRLLSIILDKIRFSLLYSNPEYLPLSYSKDSQDYIDAIVSYYYSEYTRLLL